MKYFYLQIKKLLKILPFTVIVSTVLLFLAITVFSQFSYALKSEDNARFKIAVVGNTKSRFFNIGIAALKTLDSSRFAVDIELADEETAREELIRGDISAYVVVPKGFVKAAQYGKIIPISYYTTSSTIDVSALMRDEITKVVSVFLKESQKGVFGEEKLLSENGYKDIAIDEINDLNIKYIDFIIDRTKMYKTEITGVSYGLDLINHLFIGYFVIFLCVSVIPVCCLHIRRDNSMLKVIKSSGGGIVYTVFYEFAATLLIFITSLLAVLAILFTLIRLGALTLPDIGINMRQFIISALPVALTVCAFAFFIFEVSGNIISAVTGFFFASMFLCYITGCMYPLYSLPPLFQKIAAFMPSGAARAYISKSVLGQNAETALFTLLLYSLLFITACVIIRNSKILKGEA